MAASAASDQPWCELEQVVTPHKHDGADPVRVEPVATWKRDVAGDLSIGVGATPFSASSTYATTAVRERRSTSSAPNSQATSLAGGPRRWPRWSGS